MHKNASQNEQRRAFKAAINAVDLGERELIKPEGYDAADEYIRKLKARKIDVEARLVRLNSQIGMAKSSLGRNENYQLRNSYNRMMAERANLVREKSDIDMEIQAKKPALKEYNMKLNQMKSEQWTVDFYNAARLMLSPDVFKRIIDVAHAMKGKDA